MAALAVVGVVIILLVTLGSGEPERGLVTRYVTAWSRGAYPTMYGMLDAGSQESVTEPDFASAYRHAAATATATGVAVRRVGKFRDGVVPVVMTVHTRLFGTLQETLEVSVSGTGSDAHVGFTPAVLFPGLRGSERLTRHATLPPRAALLTSDGAHMASIPDVASAIGGTVGPIPAAQAAEFAAAGYPPGAHVGLNGLERIFERRLAGTPGETLLAGSRVLAHRASRRAPDLKTTIDPPIERALVTAIAGRYAGMVALDPRSGAVLGAAGVGFSALQPPGSTMKIVTATAALEGHVARLSSVYPIDTEAVIDGYHLQNAGGEACGGTLLNAFAVSCNSVFAPLGVRVGPRRLVAVAERFGFNSPSPIPAAPASTIPRASALHSDLEVGSSAIGQGKVQATTLAMADIAATIAMGGRRPVPTLVADQPPRFVAVTTPAIARLIERMMIAVVSFGTGTSAAIPGVEVAGKTGTAELRSTVNPNDPNASAATNTDAWFVGYAPVGRPRIVVGALFPGQGAGGATAAPAVHDVLVTALETTH